jgi:transposase
MYFRTKKIKNSLLVQLVESYRNSEGLPRQRVVASLGDAKLPQSELKLIAQAIELKLLGQEQHEFSSNELSAEASAWVTRILKIASRSNYASFKVDSEVIDGVLVDKVSSENIVELGPELVAMQAWDALNFSDILRNVGISEHVIPTAKLMIANRLIEPLSEWAIIDWSDHSALAELLDVRLTKTTKDRLYKVSDNLLKVRKEIEESLCKEEKELFQLRRSIALYDVTNTHFEGTCTGNQKAKFGKNKQKRNDCPQVAIGMVFDEYGFALAHEVFEGNMADTSTLETMLDRLKISDTDLSPVVVLDAGFASEKNLELLEGRGFSYIVNITRNSRLKYADEFNNTDFRELKGRAANKKVEVKTIVDPEHDNRRLLLCKSSLRAAKEEAMISKAEARFIDDAEKLKKRIEKGQLKQTEVIERKIGAVLKKHSRVKRFYKLVHEQQTLQILCDNEKIEQFKSQCGQYVIKTDQQHESEKLWHLYMTLLRAERGFKMLKGELGLRPNFHQREDRVDGHIFISVLAYHLLCWIHHRLESNGDMREWKTIRRLLRTHCLVTTILPLKDGRVIRIRKPSVPEAEQAKVYANLGLDWKNKCPARITETKKSTTL